MRDWIWLGSSHRRASSIPCVVCMQVKICDIDECSLIAELHSVPFCNVCCNIEGNKHSY